MSFVSPNHACEFPDDPRRPAHIECAEELCIAQQKVVSKAASDSSTA